MLDHLDILFTPYCQVMSGVCAVCHVSLAYILASSSLALSVNARPHFSATCTLSHFLRQTVRAVRVWCGKRGRKSIMCESVACVGARDIASPSVCVVLRIRRVCRARGVSSSQVRVGECDIVSRAWCVCVCALGARWGLIGRKI